MLISLYIFGIAIKNGRDMLILNQANEWERLYEVFGNSSKGASGFFEL
jgi:hypothetical protein